MKASIITTVLDSHEIVRRQVLYLNAVLPDGVEWILVDDGSQPPIEVSHNDFPLTLHRTNDFRPWTERAARVSGIQRASSDRLICVDIDHIVTNSLVMFAIDTDYDFISFQRQLAILTEAGELDNSADSLLLYGVAPDRIRSWGTRTTPPGNCYAISRPLFMRLHGSSFRGRLKRHISRLARKGEASVCGTDERPLIYTIPNGRYCGDADTNPYGLFHSLSRKTQAYEHAEDVPI